jgi:hypothetical protein
MYKRICAMTAIVGIIVGLAMMMTVASAHATTLTNRITGVDQNANPVTLMCSRAHCHDIWGSVYGDPTTVTGDLWKVQAAARGYTWRLVGPVNATCQPDATVVGFELLCLW